MDPILLPSRHSIISLQDITLHNWEKITTLIVNKDQLNLVRPNLESLCEHQFHLPASIVRAIVADKTPVGYIRLQLEDQIQKQTENGSVSEIHSTFHLLSFMIDQSCQGLGFGTKAMQLLQKEIISLRGQEQGHQGIKVFTKPFDAVRPEDSPEHFFAGLGFKKDKDQQARDVMIWTSQP